MTRVDYDTPDTQTKLIWTKRSGGRNDGYGRRFTLRT
jgi:hypothetical protein